jgi:GT2 family glycosyltransferase
MKDLSVIIVSYKGWERLGQCLEALNAFSGSLFAMEVIIVDNSSDSAIKEIEKVYPRFRFIQNNVNGGFANGCNLGADYSEGKFLLFLNPDTVVAEGEIGRLLKISEQNPDFYITSCRQVNEMGKESKATGEFPGIRNLTGFQRSFSGIYRRKLHDWDGEISFPDWVSGSVIMIRKEIFRRINGFDEDFWMYYEDVDLSRRIHDIGGRIAFFRNICVEHNHGGSSRINTQVSSITKTEVLISKHLYISKSKSGIEKIVIQIFLVINNLVSGIIQAVPGTLLFFVPKMYIRTLMFIRLSGYYTGALVNRTWISRRSVNFRKQYRLR